MTTSGPMRPRRGPGVLGWVAAALLVIPVVELAVIIQVGRLIGPWPTIVLLVAESALGAWLLRREGSGAWRALSASLAEGRSPSRELADAALVLTGGLLLLTPGFVTDIVGFALVLPVTRPLARGLATRWLARRIVVRSGGVPAREVVGEVVEPDDEDPRA